MDTTLCPNMKKCWLIENILHSVSQMCLGQEEEWRREGIVPGTLCRPSVWPGSSHPQAPFRLRVFIPRAYGSPQPAAPLKGVLCGLDIWSTPLF